MKKLITALAILALLTLPTFGEKLGSRTKLHATATITLSEALPTNPAPSCACSCGKSCDGGCSGHVSGCGIVEGLMCIIDCCQGAPSATPEECGNVLPVFP